MGYCKRLFERNPPNCLISSFLVVIPASFLLEVALNLKAIDCSLVLDCVYVCIAYLQKGISEELVGKAIKKYNIPREKLVILTKCYSPSQTIQKVNGSCLIMKKGNPESLLSHQIRIPFFQHQFHTLSFHADLMCSFVFPVSSFKSSFILHDGGLS